VGCLLEPCEAKVKYCEAGSPAIDEISAEFDLVLTMCQSLLMLQKLRKLEHKTLFLNKPSSSLGCHRHTMLKKLARNDILHPEWSLTPAAKLLSSLGGSIPYWIKRPDVHAEEEMDVVLINGSYQLHPCMQHFLEKKITQVIVQQHLVGRVLKCYAVPSADFFYCAGIVDLSERLVTEIKNLVARLGMIFELAIYGVDIMLTNGEELFVIDVNDWPSFRVCPDLAARAIAQLVRSTLTALPITRN
jgi:hypothetical protein